ncbi:7250_t:CDS:2, partial [Racocetra fulgida]
VGDEFPTVESFKEVAQEGAKAAGFAFSALYKLEEKYDHLNDSGSKATFLHKIEALVSEEIVIPKAPLPNASKKHPTSTKRDPLLSEIQDKAAIKKEKNIKNVKNSTTYTTTFSL